MKITKVLQIRESTPNPVTNLSGYVPTTDYWGECIAMTNALMDSIARSDKTPPKKFVRDGADTLIELEIFPDEKPHTAIEWAEFVMAVNHVLWLLNDAPKDEMINLTMEVLNDLYYAWHDKALSTLKGDDLSKYLRITD